ncbi:hypothetical protein D3C81_2019530 [compost metagenome]
MHKVEIGPVFDTAKQPVTRFRVNAVPAHVRQRQAKVGHLWHIFFDDTQQVYAIALFAATPQDLHPQANAQHRLCAGFNQLDQLTLVDLIHRRLRRSDAR